MLTADGGDWRAFFVILPVYKAGSPQRFHREPTPQPDRLRAGRVSHPGYGRDDPCPDARTDTDLISISLRAAGEPEPLPSIFVLSRRRTSPERAAAAGLARRGPALVCRAPGRRRTLEAESRRRSPAVPALRITTAPGWRWPAACLSVPWSRPISGHPGRQSVVALKRANTQLSAQNERFDAALQNMLQGLLMLDAGAARGRLQRSLHRDVRAVARDREARLLGAGASAAPRRARAT